MRQLLSLQEKLIKYDDVVSASPASDAMLLLLLALLIHTGLVLNMVLVLAGLVPAGLVLAAVFLAGGAFLLLVGTLAARARLLGCCGRLLFGVLAVAWAHLRAHLGVLRRGL